jgi:pimeloyl-ACP methyl ester carboxylesterase
MPALAKNYTVIAHDLRGLGDSSKQPTGYDGKTVAGDIHQLVTQLGFNTIFLVGHDIGTQVAYSYAAAHPTAVRMVGHIPSNTRRTRSPCTKKRDDVFIMVLSQSSV